MVSVLVLTPMHVSAQMSKRQITVALPLHPGVSLLPVHPRVSQSSP